LVVRVACSGRADADGSSLAQTAHKNRGTSGTLGLPQFVDLAVRLEEEAVAGRLEAAAAALAELVQLVKQVSQQRAIRPKHTTAVERGCSGWFKCADPECPGRHASRDGATAAPCAVGSYKCEMLGCHGHEKPGDRCRGMFL